MWDLLDWYIQTADAVEVQKQYICLETVKAKKKYMIPFQVWSYSEEVFLCSDLPTLGWSQVCCDQGLRHQEAAKMTVFVSWGCPEAISTSLSQSSPEATVMDHVRHEFPAAPLPVKAFWHSAVLCSHRCLQRTHWYDSAADLAVILSSAEPKHINRQNTSFRIIRNSGHYSSHCKRTCWQIVRDPCHGKILIWWSGCGIHWLFLKGSRKATDFNFWNNSNN